jgi:DNA-binding MarR family transcriptional regulator
MRANFESAELVLRLWRQVYQTYTLLKKCEDQIFGDHGLTTEQYGVLVAIDYFGGSTKVTDIARWLERSTNSISMIVDRMVKAGLVRRARSTGDRREVRVTNTSKGQDALKPANLASLEVVQKILSPLSHEDRLTLLSLLGTIKYEILEYLNPGVDIEEIKKNELKQAANLTKWLSEYGLPSTPQAKRQSGAKRKTIGRG